MAGEIVAIDFLTVPTITFQTLYVFILLSLDRRLVVHFHVTRHPTSDWTALQLVQAFPFDIAPKYLDRDRDRIYGEEVLWTIQNLEKEDRPTSPRSPWQNGYCERMVGTLKRRRAEKSNHLNVKMGGSDFALVFPLQSNHTYHRATDWRGGEWFPPEGKIHVKLVGVSQVVSIFGRS